SKVLSRRSRYRPYVYMRSIVYRQLVDSGHSYPAIASASGYDHTTIIYNVRNLDSLEDAAVRWRLGTYHKEALPRKKKQGPRKTMAPARVRGQVYQPMVTKAQMMGGRA